MPDNEATNDGDLNPSSDRPGLSAPQALIVHRIATLASYVVLLFTAIYYTFKAPTRGQGPNHTIWGNNEPTPFTQNSVITSIYWIIIFILQFMYILSFYSSDADNVSQSANLTTHHVSSTLLIFAFIHLWVRSHFYIALLLLVVNFINLTTAYFRHRRRTRFLYTHIGIIAGPLAWNFVALYWVGARAVDTDRLVARVVGNVFIWGFMAYAGFYLVAFNDWMMSFAMSILTVSTAVGQFLTKLPVLQLQWIFAFVIGGIIFVASAMMIAPAFELRGQLMGETRATAERRQREPLLAEE